MADMHSAEPRKPYDEKPLPVGIAQPPDGFFYVGMGVSGIRPFACIGDGLFAWDSTKPHETSAGIPSIHYAAPAELCNRLPSAPESQRVIAAPPKQAEAVKGRFIITGIALVDCAFDTAEEAYEAAEDAVKLKPDATVNVYQLRSKFAASVNVNRTDY